MSKYLSEPVLTAATMLTGSAMVAGAARLNCRKVAGGSLGHQLLTASPFVGTALGCLLSDSNPRLATAAVLTGYLAGAVGVCSQKTPDSDPVTSSPDELNDPNPDPNGPSLAILSNQRHLLPKVLDYEQYERLYAVRTRFGNRLDNCIQVGVDNPDGNPADPRGNGEESCGMAAADADCYRLFRPVFAQVIQQRLGRPIVPSATPNWQPKGHWPPLPPQVQSVEVHLHRNLAEFAFAPSIDRCSRRRLHNVLEELMTVIMPADVEYVLLSESIDDENLLNLLRSMGFYQSKSPPNPYEIAIGQNRDHLDGRAIFVSRDGSMAALINALDHLVLIGRDQTGDLNKAVDTVSRLDQAAGDWLRCHGEQTWRSCGDGQSSDRPNGFAYDDQFGYLTVLPEMAGSAMVAKATVTISSQVAPDQLIAVLRENRLGLQRCDQQLDGDVRLQVVTLDTFTESGDQSEIIDQLFNGLVETSKLSSLSSRPVS